jgi:DNA-binding transcriptional MerR regulator/methylmalonyl-CoA mutase cobalamin-binding subunit
MVVHTMYTIKQVAVRTGLGAPLIRAWERRYGVVEPTRTPSGYRLYDDQAIAVLLAMRGLLERGWTASEAARAIRAGDVAVGEVVSEPPSGSGTPAESTRDHRRQMIDAFVAAAESASPVETEAALDEILASGSFEAVIDDVLLPATAALGESWAAGRLSVAAEHAASGAVARRLAAAYQAAATDTRTRVLVGLPPGSRHELGALAFAVALRRRGVGVMYLGPDVPVDAWVDVARRTKARAAVVAIVTEVDRAPAATVIDALRAVPVRTVAVGGAAANGDRGDAVGDVDLDDVLVLPPRVVDASAAVAQAIGRRP